MCEAGPSSSPTGRSLRNKGGKTPPTRSAQKSFDSAFQSFSKSVSGIPKDQKTPSAITTLALIHAQGVYSPVPDPKTETGGVVELLPSLGEVREDDLEMYTFLKEWRGEHVGLQAMLVPQGVTNIRIKDGELCLVCAKYPGFELMTEYALDLGPIEPSEQFFRFIVNVSGLNLRTISEIDEFMLKDPSMVQTDYLLGIEQVDSLIQKGIFQKIPDAELEDVKELLKDIQSVLKLSDNGEDMEEAEDPAT